MECVNISLSSLIVLASSDISCVAPLVTLREPEVREEEEEDSANKAAPPSSGVEGRGVAMAIPSGKIEYTCTCR